jgi:peptide/nickel transport system permease protein
MTSLTAGDRSPGGAGPPIETAPPVSGHRRYWAIVASDFFRNPVGIVGVALLATIVAFSFIGPLFYTVDPNGIDAYTAPLAHPSSAHLVGTDYVGRDLLARLMAGGQSSLEVGIAAAFLAIALGAVYGAVSGLVGGAFDGVMMRLVDVALAIPVLLLLLLLAASVSVDIGVMILIIGLTSWLVPARLIRAETLTLRTREYVQAVQIMGGSRTRVIGRHILPNSLGTIVVNVTFQIADAILILSYLSFLGLGIPPPAATWGGILSDGLTNIAENAWWSVYPAGACIVLTVLAFNFMGHALQQTFEHRLDR